MLPMAFTNIKNNAMYCCVCLCSNPLLHECPVGRMNGETHKATLALLWLMMGSRNHAALDVTDTLSGYGDKESMKERVGGSSECSQRDRRPEGTAIPYSWFLLHIRVQQPDQQALSSGYLPQTRSSGPDPAI